MNPTLMGVVNVTPDSFSDGGLYLDAGAAIARGRELVGQGADILDVGGESTRPGAGEVSAEEELARVGPVVEGLAGVGTVSVDTSKLAVAEAALDVKNRSTRAFTLGRKRLPRTSDHLISAGPPPVR